MLFHRRCFLFRSLNGRFGSTWFQHGEPSDHGDGDSNPISTSKILNYVVERELDGGVTRI
jgi:hypothetical protein